MPMLDRVPRSTMNLANFGHFVLWPALWVTLVVVVIVIIREELR